MSLRRPFGVSGATTPAADGRFQQHAANRLAEPTRIQVTRPAAANNVMASNS